MLKAFLLICAAGLAPADCTPDTAQHVLALGAVPSPQACLAGAELRAARLNEADAYPKVICERPAR